MELVDFTYIFKDGRRAYGHKRRYFESVGLGGVFHKSKVCVHNVEECAESLAKLLYQTHRHTGTTEPLRRN